MDPIHERVSARSARSRHATSTERERDQHQGIDRVSRRYRAASHMCQAQALRHTSRAVCVCVWLSVMSLGPLPSGPLSSSVTVSLSLMCVWSDAAP